MIPQHGAKLSARYIKILLNYTSMAVGISAKHDSNISNNNMINNINIDDRSTIFYLDFLTVISRIITVTRYACRYLTVTFFISNNGKPCYRPEFTLSVVRAKRTDEWKLYTDSDHAGDAPTTSKSHTGIIFFLNGMAVHWESKKQPITALSSAAAEVYAFSEAVKEDNSLLWRAEEAGIKVKWPINIFEDNKATISFQQSTQPSTKLKGVYNLRWHWVLELRDTNKYMATKVATDQNIAGFY